MPYCALLQVLLLVGACFSTWAAPLQSTSSPRERRCDGTEQQSRDISEHPANHHDDKMCISSSVHLASSPLVQESRGAADVLSTAEHEEMKFAVTDAILGHIGQSELFQSSTKSYTESTEFTDESLAEEKSQKLSSASSYKSLPFVEHTVGPGNENIEKEPSTSPEDFAEQKVEPSRLPVQLRTERPVKTKLAVEHSDYISLSYSDIEDRRTAHPLTNPRPLKQEGAWEVTTINNQFGEQKSSRVISTKTQFSANAFVSQSPRNVNSDLTAITTSGSYDGNPGGSIQDKERVAEVYLFTAAEQDKALVPGLLQPDLTLSSRLVELGDTWTEPVHLQGVEEASVLPLLQDVGTEATMSSEDLPLIFEPLDDVTPSSSSSLASELSVAMVPATGMLEETDQTLSMDTDHSPHQSFPGPSDWPLPWQMSGGENSDTVSSSQMPVRGPFSEADVEHSERTERLQNPDVLATSVVMLRLSPSPLSATTQKVIDIKSTHPAVLKPVSGLDELESQEDDDEKHESAEDSEEEEEEEEEESEEELTEVPVHSPTRPPYILIPPPPVWGQRNQGLIRSWVKLIREKAGYVSGMLAPVGIGIAGALLIVGALYGIRMIHRKRRNSLKHQRRKQPTEVRSGPDQAMLLADSSEDEF